MKYLLSIIISASVISPVYALEFHVCTDSDGIRHISNHAEFFNPDCTIRKDVYLQVLRMQHAELQDRYMINDSANAEATGKIDGIRQGITDRISELLDHEKALDELQKHQEQRRGDLPFKTHLQTEGFQRLLELH